MSTLVIPSELNENPLLQSWDNQPYGLPPFKQIQFVHYKPALQFAFQSHLDELQHIVQQKDAPTFENTIVPLDQSGRLVEKIASVFQNQCSSYCPPELQEIQTELNPLLAEHQNAIYTFPGLFSRIEAVYDSISNGSVELDSVQKRLVETFRTDFIQGGARFDGETKARYKEIVLKLSSYTTLFMQNVMKDEGEYLVQLSEEEVAGLSQDLISSAKEIAAARDLSGYAVILSRSVVVPFLTYSPNREVREKLWKAWVNRGALDPSRNNSEVIVKILQLRAEQAKLHQCKHYGEYNTKDTMAKTPEAIMDLLTKAWEPAKKSYQREQSKIEEYIRDHEPGFSFPIQPWDWRYYAEKIKIKEYDVDFQQIKGYFPLDRMCEAIFDCAHRLFGIKFVPLEIESYQPDVKTYEVKEVINGEEKTIAIFIHDLYCKQYKQGGAWMAEYRKQQANLPDGQSYIPIIVNNCNFAKPLPGEQSLLSFDDAKTLFHEFGHGLHGMLSLVRYNKLAGVDVLKDYVELPSQLFEHWLSEEVVLQQHARHHQTHEPIPLELVGKLMKSLKFNQGFETVEYVSCAIVDQLIHKLTDIDDSFNPVEFEKQSLEEIGMPATAIMRHRLTHFLHLYASTMYAAGYYVYIWAEVLDADGFEAFTEKNDPFDRDVAKRLREYIYSSGNTMDPAVAYRSFRGRDPVVEPMLKKRGLCDA